MKTKEIKKINRKSYIIQTKMWLVCAAFNLEARYCKQKEVNKNSQNELCKESR